MNIFSPKKKLLIFRKITCKVPKTNKKSTLKKVLFACDIFLIFTAVKHKEFPLSTNSLGKNLNNSKTVKTVTLAVICLSSHSFHIPMFIYLHHFTLCTKVQLIHFVIHSHLINFTNHTPSYIHSPYFVTASYFNVTVSFIFLLNPVSRN